MVLYSVHLILICPLAYALFVIGAREQKEKEMLVIEIDWTHLHLHAEFWHEFAEHHFLPFANRSYWFGGKARCSLGATVRHVIDWSAHAFYLLIIDVDYEDGSESYLLPLGFLPSKTNDLLEKAIVAEIAHPDYGNFILIDAIYDESFRRALFHHFTLGTSDTSLSVTRFEDIDDSYLSSNVLTADSINSLIVFNDKYLFKLYRKLSTGSNLEIEMIIFIKKSGDFSDHIPSCLGAIYYSSQHRSSRALVVVQNFIQNTYDCWSMMTGVIDQHLSEDVLVKRVELLGRRTAEMHLSLYKPNCTNTDFTPEKFTQEYCQWMTRRLTDRLNQCYSKLETWPSTWTETILNSKELLSNFIKEFESYRSFQSCRIRVHGDFHLGQVLFNTTDDDYTVIDFEGDPFSTAAELHLKHSPLKDVAGMIRSFHYAANLIKKQWFRCARDAFLHSFLKHAGLLWTDIHELKDLILFHTLERAVHEFTFAINYFPEGLEIPLCGLVDVIGEVKKWQQTSLHWMRC